MMGSLVGVVAALEKEARPFLERINPRKLGKIFYGEYADIAFAVIISNYGKVRAASSTQHLIDCHPELEYVVHLGSAGGINPALKIGDIVVPEKIIEYDVGLYFAPDEMKEHEVIIDNLYSRTFRTLLNPYMGISVSGDRDVVDAETKKAIYEKYNALCADWESFAVARVCEMNNVPCIVVRTISDDADNSAPETFFENIHKVSKNLADNILSVYDRLKDMRDNSGFDIR